MWKKRCFYVADSMNDTIRQVDRDGNVETICGNKTAFSNWQDGAGSDAIFFRPTGIASLADGTLFVTDRGNHSIRKISFGKRGTFITTLCGSPTREGFTDGSDGTGARFHCPFGLAISPITGNLYVADNLNHAIREVTQEGRVRTICGNGCSGFRDGECAEALFSYPTGESINTLLLLTHRRRNRSVFERDHLRL